MIAYSKYKEIDTLVQEAIKEVFITLKSKNISDYIMLLFENDLINILGFSGNKTLPSFTDSFLDRLNDTNQFEFVNKFLSKYYGFSNAEFLDETEYRINIELMIYLKIWESKWFLRKLHRIAHILNNEEYQWSVNIPDYNKYNFISNDIIKCLNKNNLKLFKIIKKGYHSSLRNAIAHSEYHFSLENINYLYLSNYKNKDWELEKLSFNEWNERFLYTIMLYNHLQYIIYQTRINIKEDLGTNTFLINQPLVNGKHRVIEVHFNNGNTTYSLID